MNHLLWQVPLIVKSQTSFDVPAASDSLANQYQDLQEALSAFTVQVIACRNSMPVEDEASRALFLSVSRISAYTDQMHMIMSLMSEDMRVAEELGSAPGQEFESLEQESCFYEWLRKSRNGSMPVN